LGEAANALKAERMPADDPPQGARFSHVYLERGEPAQDSRRMRRRLASVVWSWSDDSRQALAKLVTRELGVAVPYNVGYNWWEFFDNCEIRDVLDLVTVAFRQLFFGRGGNWLGEVQRIFAEENVHYRVDNQGGVHFYLDEQFAGNRAATIAALQSARYANVLHSFEGGLAALSQVPPDGKGAIRATFAAVEGLFRLIFPKAPRLGAKESEALRPLLQAAHAGDNVAQSASGKLLTSFKEWIDAAHLYRHEQGKEEVAQPPLTLAVYLTSTGASHLRWLAELDAANQKMKATT
jgi:hypothetical protein